MRGCDAAVRDKHEFGPARAAQRRRAGWIEAIGFPGNAADPEAVRSLADAAVSRYGALHVAFNNAGIGGPLGPLAEIDIEAYRQLMEVNLHAVFYAMRYEIPAMTAARCGAILNIDGGYTAR